MIPIEHQPPGYWARNLYKSPHKRPKSDDPLKDLPPRAGQRFRRARGGGRAPEQVTGEGGVMGTAGEGGGVEEGGGRQPGHSPPLGGGGSGGGVLAAGEERGG